jgi:hypothetical protein
MKTVYNNDMVCHIWANQSQDNARNSNNTIFFEGRQLFSYRRSFKIGEIITAPNGEEWFFINDNKYSNTTAKHIISAFRATNSVNKIRVNMQHPIFGMSYFGSHNVHKCEQYLKDYMESLLKEQTRARSYTWIISTINIVHLTYKRFCEAFGLEFTSLEQMAYYNEARAKADLIGEKQRVKKEKEKEKEQQNLAKWLRHEYNKTIYNVPVHLRLSRDDQSIETTRGASVPIPHALRLWDMIQKGEHILGQRIGHFTANSVNEDRIRIGCHEIPLAIATEFMEKLKEREKVREWVTV